MNKKFLIFILVFVFGGNIFGADLNELKKNQKKSPGSFSANYELGSFYEQNRKYDEAILYLKKAIEIDKSKVMAHVLLGGCYDALKKYGESEKIYRNALKIDPKNDFVCSLLGMSLTELGDFNGAVKYFNMSLKLNKKNRKDSAILFGLGNAYVNLKQYKKAVNPLKNAVELNPKLKNGILLLGLSYNETGESEKAFDQYVKLQKLDRELAVILLEYLSRS